jgi:hypothetical protein
MLGPPASLSGKSAGLVSLGSVPDLLGAYQAGGHFARRKSAEEHRESLVKISRGLHRIAALDNGPRQQETRYGSHD